MTLKRKLFEPKEIKEMYPVSAEGFACKKENDRQIQDILAGRSDKMILIIGPCSADHEDSVIDYINRLRPVQDAVKDKFVFRGKFTFPLGFSQAFLGQKPSNFP